jgi:hypothetical protein
MRSAPSKKAKNEISVLREIIHAPKKCAAILTPQHATGGNNFRLEVVRGSGRSGNEVSLRLSNDL